MGYIVKLQLLLSYSIVFLIMSEKFNPIKAISAAVSRARERRNVRRMNEIADRGATTVVLTDQNGSFPEAVPMFSWQSVYDSYIEAGLSPEQAKAETDKRVWILG
jgi:hypothetical protein